MSPTAGTRPRPSSRYPSATRHRDHGVQLSTRRLGSVTVISVVGEVDASNSRHVALYVRNRLAECDYLGVDMGEVKFLGVSAISTLHCINVECAKRGIPWVLAPSAEVSRVLRICAPGCAFPLADDVTAGIAKLKQ